METLASKIGSSNDLNNTPTNKEVGGFEMNADSFFSFILNIQELNEVNDRNGVRMAICDFFGWNIHRAVYSEISKKHRELGYKSAHLKEVREKADQIIIKCLKNNSALNSNTLQLILENI